MVHPFFVVPRMCGVKIDFQRKLRVAGCVFLFCLADGY